MYQECRISHFTFLICHYSCFACVQIRHHPLSGGYCGGVPPLPIPNREVKPTCADGTAMQCGRVGRRLLSMKSLRFRKISEAFLFFFPRIFFFSAVFFFSLNISLSRRFRRWRRFFLIDYLSPTDFTDSHKFFLIDYFSPTDFTDSHRFFSSIILVPQISRIHTDFSHWLFFSWIYTDFLCFSSFPVISSFFCHFFISQILDLSVWEDNADFSRRLFLSKFYEKFL